MQILTAYDFGAPMGSEDKAQNVFGIQLSRTAQALRDLADAIEQQQVHVIAVEVATKAKPEEWTESALELKYTQKVKLPLGGRQIQLK